jgi:hypothetical protein
MIATGNNSAYFSPFRGWGGGKNQQTIDNTGFSVLPKFGIRQIMPN